MILFCWCTGNFVLIVAMLCMLLKRINGTAASTMNFLEDMSYRIDKLSKKRVKNNE